MRELRRKRKAEQLLEAAKNPATNTKQLKTSTPSVSVPKPKPQQLAVMSPNLIVYEVVEGDQTPRIQEKAILTPTTNKSPEPDWQPVEDIMFEEEETSQTFYEDNLIETEKDYIAEIASALQSIPAKYHATAAKECINLIQKFNNTS